MTKEKISHGAECNFKGEPNPHKMPPENKFNAMQQQAYVALMFVLIPAQIITGVFLWKVGDFANYIELLGGIRIVDTIHVLLFYFFVSFMIAHTYLATLGQYPHGPFQGDVHRL